MREIKLYGALGRKYGRSFRLAVKSPREAARALSRLLPGFRRDFVGPDGAQEYRVYSGRHGIAESEADMQGEGPIRFVPVIAGAKNGVFQTIAGVALIAVGYYTTNPYIIQAGIALGLGGVVQLLTPVPKASGPADGLESDYFSGPVNLSAEGNPVPVLLGEGYVGSVVISAGIKLNQIDAEIGIDNGWQGNV